MDLISVLPNFPFKSYTHLLPSLERNRLTTVDLITLDTLEVAKRAHLPPADVRRLSTHIIEALHGSVGFEAKQSDDVALDASASFGASTEVEPGPRTELDLEDWSVISTLDPGIDALLGGGIPTGYLTEVTGESGSGKTQFLLSLLLSVQLPAPRGLGKRALYISTEAPLSTPRLSQMIESHPYLCSLPSSLAPSLTNILSINVMDLESQDHILNYQVPVAVERYNVGLIVIDSITANYRAEHASTTLAALSTRSSELSKLGQMLRNLAVAENVAIVVANQVSDRFADIDDPAIPLPLHSHRGSGTASPLSRKTSGLSDTVTTTSSSAIQSSPYADEETTADWPGNRARNEVLSLQHQQRFFTGWGDTRASFSDTFALGAMSRKPAEKTPALGLVWSAQIACRIALKREECRCGRNSAQGVNDMVSEQIPINEAQGLRLGVSDLPTGGTQPLGRDEQRVTSEVIIARTMKLAIAPWTGGLELGNGTRDEVEFEILESGLCSKLTR